MTPEPASPESRTACRLLDAAEQLFAQKGWAGASIREITQAAGVNVAAAHYHFGSKEALQAAVVERHMAQVMAERLRLLDEAEGAGALDLHAVVRAFVLPILAQAEDPEKGAGLLRLVGRTLGDPDGPWRTACESPVFQRTRDRFHGAFTRCLPGLSPVQVHWRMHFLMGSIVHVVLHGDVISRTTGGVVDPNDLSDVQHELIAFLVAGLAVETTASPPDSRDSNS